MSTGRHSLQTVADGIHISHAYEYANAAARTGASGFAAGDVGKLAKETDTLTWWVLVDTSPTWKELTPGSISETITTLTESPADIFTYTSEDSTSTEIDISDFETTTELNARDTNNRNRANHTSTQTASTISDFDTEVSNNSSVTANTAKVTNSSHTSEVTGSSALTVDPTAISNKALKSSPGGSEEVLINDGGTLKKTTAQDIADLGGGGGTDADAIHDNVAAEINAVTEKGVPVSADLILIEDSADSNNKKKIQIGNLPSGGGADADAIHDNIAAEISAITEKTTPVSADLLIIEDSADSNNKKKVQVGNLPGGGGGSDPSSWMDRAAFTDNNSYINTSNDFTTDAANAVPIDITHTPNATGVYLITIDVLWSVDSGTFDQQGELVVDNGSAGTATTVRWRYRAEPKDAAGVPDAGGSAGTNQRFPATLKYLHTTTASTAFNVIFRHMPTDDGIESTVKASVLTIERWS